MTDCPNCTKPVTNATICTTCIRQLRHQLAALPDLLTDLEITTTRQDNFAPQTDIHAGPPVPPLPYNPTAGDHHQTITRSLTAWTSLIHHQDTRQQLPTLTPNEAIHYLQRAIPRHYADPWLADLANDIDRHTRRARQLVDTPSVKTTIHVGPCPQPDNQDGVCGGDIYAWFPTDTTQRPVMQCETCGHQWPPEQWTQAGRAIIGLQARQQQARTLAAAITRRTAWNRSSASTTPHTSSTSHAAPSTAGSPKET